jgi:hypothetical protein
VLLAGMEVWEEGCGRRFTVFCAKACMSRGMERWSWRWAREHNGVEVDCLETRRRKLRRWAGIVWRTCYEFVCLKDTRRVPCYKHGTRGHTSSTTRQLSVNSPPTSK